MQTELRRDLGLPHALLTVIGFVIGSGIFALPAVVLTKTQAPGLGILIWVVGGFISMAAGLTIAELAAAMPKAGGTYEYLREAYGDWLGFLQGWATFLAYNSAMQAALAMMFSMYLSALIPMSSLAQTLVGLGMIALLTWVNALGVRFGGVIQVAATLGKLVPIALLIFFGLTKVDAAHLSPMLAPGVGIGGALAGALLPVLFAYDGWINVGQLSEEVKNPQRNLPLALIGGIAFVTVVYTVFNVVLSGVLPAATIMASEKPVLPLAQLLFGDAGSRLITVGMLVSMFGTLNAVVMTSPRYYYAMARDGLFPAAERIVKVHPKYQTPTAALLISAGWSAVLLLTGQFGQLLNLVVFVAWLFYVLTMAAVFVLRKKRPEMNRPYKVWFYPVVPAVGIAAGLFILGSTLVTDMPTALLGLGLTLTGVPVYLYLRRKQAGAAAMEQKAA